MHPSHLCHAAVTRICTGRAHPTQLQALLVWEFTIHGDCQPLEYPVNVLFYYKVGLHQQDDPSLGALGLALLVDPAV